MIYDLIHGFAFVHAPRAAGTNITLSLAPAITVASVVDLLGRRHHTARQLRDAIGSDVWQKLYSFGIHRPITEAKASWRRHVIASRAALADYSHTLDPGWRDYLIATQDIEDADELWRFANLPSDDEAWKTFYFADQYGRIIVSEIIPYSMLAQKWSYILRRCNIPQDLPLIH